MHAETKARREHREPRLDKVRVLWQDRAGYDRFATVRSYDVSESGMRLELPEAVEPRSLVRLQCPSLGIQGSASVRYCTRQGPAYQVGLEFLGGLAWKLPAPTSSES